MQVSLLKLLASFGGLSKTSEQGWDIKQFKPAKE